MRSAALALAVLAAPLTAQGPQPPQPVLASGESLEVIVRADFNADGRADLAYVAAGEERRELRVVTTYRNQFEVGENIPQVLALDAYHLAPAELTAKGNVLVLRDLTGGTTAVASTHRFRWDAKMSAMRLIGLDATLYSRTFAHDGREASWNLLTGALVTRTLKLNKGSGDQAYDTVAERTSKKPSPPLPLEASPGGDALLGWPGGK
ncbi:hypothetical protein [Erythrobacter sp. WG]|uniref:hypothetical protein n=1 Tax=Erythrobacter sp. WG TaxID=2985510 RepID=UPI002271C019|nr:hypothetical protein [Erythrobacter sp. WG]MCX9146873.1 hypothetical protein [Erythrobacter sp. WG]